MFNIGFKALFNHYNGFDIKITEYGKPNSATYEFVENMVKTKKCYMIGDNLKTDI